MNKLHLSPVLAAGVAVAVQINHDQAFADTTFFTTGTSFSGTDFTVPITPAIANADELLSISGGSAFGEGSTFEILVDYANGSQQEIYSTTLNPPSAFQFNTIPAETFAEGTINGLTFENFGGSGGKTQSIPSGTTFTFDVVSTPEPAAAALAVLGAGGLWLAARRRAGQKD